MNNQPFFTDDTIVFGLLMLALGFVFYTSSSSNLIWKKFYKYIPALLMAYMLPGVFTTIGLIAPEWTTVSESGKVTTHTSQVYYVASRFLLPASLVFYSTDISRSCRENGRLPLAVPHTNGTEKLALDCLSQ